MLRIAVDVGGTFTDVVVADADGRLILGKALTTPRRSFDGLYAALANAAAELRRNPDDLLREAGLLIYATTRAANAIVEGKVAKTAFLTTEGFPNILLYRQGGKHYPFRVDVENPPPYVPRRLTFEVPERINAEGGIERALDEEPVRAILRGLPAMGIEAIAVCLLWSIANDTHERRVGALIEALLPDIPYTLSSALNPVVREYPRASSTAIDASLKPLMQAHLRALDDDLAAAGFSGEMMVSVSSGGLLHAADAIARPVYTVKSGPAMAPVAGKAYAEAEGVGGDIIVIDTGGTTFDVSLVRAGLVKYTRESWLLGEWVGHHLGMATVDVRSVGSGGGSIAWLDSGGMLRVGPQSAGAVPGPAAFGRGGEAPTVTDAALMLGYIDAARFLGGRMPLDTAAARRAIGSLADAMGKTIVETASGILLLAGELMIEAIEAITVNDGVDPRESLLVAGGGAAGLTIVPIARALGCARVLLPRTAGGLSACGAQYSDIVTEYSASHYAHSADFDYAAVTAVLQRLRAQAEAFGVGLGARGVPDQRTDYFVEARYLNQQWEIEVPLPGTTVETADDLAALVEAFHRTHERLYAVREVGGFIECINWRVRLTGLRDKPSLARETSHRGTLPRSDRLAPAYFEPDGEVETPIYLGADLGAGMAVAGPAIIEEPTTTIVVYPGARAARTALGNYLIETGA